MSCHNPATFQSKIRLYIIYLYIQCWLFYYDAIVYRTLLTLWSFQDDPVLGNYQIMVLYSSNLVGDDPTFLYQRYLPCSLSDDARGAFGLSLTGLLDCFFQKFDDGVAFVAHTIACSYT